MSGTKTLTMPCLASWAQVPRQWKPPRFSTPTVVSQVLANSRRTLFKLMSRPSSLGCPHGFLFHAIGGRRPGRVNTKTLWYPSYWHYTDIPTVGKAQILPDVWQSMFYHQELRLLLVVYVDDFKLAGPKEHLSKGWELIKSAVDIGEPEAYDRYFGCRHKEFSQVRLPKSATSFCSCLRS